jgi:SAV_6107-like HEPN
MAAMSANSQGHPNQTISKVTPAVLPLLQSARHELATAKCATTTASKYAAAYLAALYAAAALVAARSEPRVAGSRKRPSNVWELLPTVESAFSGWAAYFTDHTHYRATGRGEHFYAISSREANKLLDDAEAFVALAEDALHIMAQSPDAAEQSKHPAVNA